jgi:8-hydroxy-5-deazaflavin:NADPH oxidoreductase
MKIAAIGYGNVGGPLADHLQRAGHEVTLAARDATSESVKRMLARNPGLKVAAPGDAVRSAEIVLLATPFQANEAAVRPIADALEGKILIDCTNPVGPGLSHGLGNLQSGTEMLQKRLPDTAVVKAFTIYGFENFENSSYPGYGVKPVMMFCGNDRSAKAKVAPLIAQLGWEPLDVGGAEQALHLEHMTLLWVRMVRMGGHSPNMVWAALRR